MAASRQIYIIATALFVRVTQAVVMQNGKSLMQDAALLETGRSQSEAKRIPGLKKNDYVEDLKSGNFGGAIAKLNLLPAAVGMKEKMQKTLAEIPSTCSEKLQKVTLPANDPNLCNRAEKLAKLLVDTTAGRTEPPWTFESEFRKMLGLNFWLYSPGVASFDSLDLDQSQGISLDELKAAFGPALIQAFESSHLFDFMDSQGYENPTDGFISRPDIVKFLFAAIMLRDYQKTLDEYQPDSSTQKVLNMAQRLHKPIAVGGPKYMSQLPKLGCIFGILIGIIVLHMMFSGIARWSSKGLSSSLSSQPEEKDEKEELAK
jgi:hypothetical protein